MENFFIFLVDYAVENLELHDSANKQLLPFPRTYNYDERNFNLAEIKTKKLREGNGNPPQYSCLENPMDGGAWWAAVHGVAKSWTRLNDFTFTFMHWRKKWQPTPLFLPGESQGWQGLVGCHLWGLTESDTTKAT